MSQVYLNVAKLVGTGVAGTKSQQGFSVKLSEDGNYLFVGGISDNEGVGAVWFYEKVIGVWTQKQKIVPTGYAASTSLSFGCSLAVNPSANTLLVGASKENTNVGASFVFTFDGTTWTQQAKLVGLGSDGQSNQGCAVGLSADANTAIVGGTADASSLGAAWIFVRSGTAWSQQGGKLVASGSTGVIYQGCSVAITSDGNLAIVGGRGDSLNIGAVWLYLRSGISWSQVGSKITGTNPSTSLKPYFGTSLALSGDDQWLIVGGPSDGSRGSAWAFKRNGTTFNQFGKKLVGAGSTSSAAFSVSIATNKIGSIVAIGGHGDSNSKGAVWVFIFNGTNFNQLGNKIVASDTTSRHGSPISLDRSGSQLLFGGYLSDGDVGAAWIYKNATITVTPSAVPTFKPTIIPTLQPSVLPTVEPTTQASALPTTQPSALPTIEPTTQPSVLPTTQPSALPTTEPTIQPSVLPTMQPSALPTVEPTTQPSALPTIKPSALPTAQPSKQPSVLPTTQPSALPTAEPTTQPSAWPTIEPTYLPTVEPTTQPSAWPTIKPSAWPTVEPTTQPSALPTIEPTYLPTLTPTIEPTWTPTQCQTVFPTITPTWSPTALPTTAVPSTEPSIPPSFAPVQVASSKLSSAGIAGIAVGAVVVFGSVSWIVTMQMKHFHKLPQQEKTSMPDHLESGKGVELKI